MLHADPTNNKNIFASTNKVVMFFKCRGGVIDEFVHSPTKAANSFVNVIVPAILSRCCVHFGFQ